MCPCKQPSLHVIFFKALSSKFRFAAAVVAVGDRVGGSMYVCACVVYICVCARARVLSCSPIGIGVILFLCFLLLVA